MLGVRWSLIKGRLCAQPAYNTGYLKEARQVAQRFISIFEESKADAIVSPSGSCTAMVHHYPQLFAGDPEWLPRARAVAAKTHELSSFLIRVLKVEDGRVVERPTDLARRVSRFARSESQERTANVDSKCSRR